MKIVAVNGGPRRGRISKTNQMLDAFLAGCREAGAEVETIVLREKNIRPCLGCYNCWIRTPGQCAQKGDDMEEILRTLLTADVEVWATPLYFFGPTAQFKTFVDRTIPLMEPWMVKKDGLLSHPTRQGRKPSDKVIISVCGFPEMEHFQPLSDWLHYLEGRGLGRIVAEIYRPAAEFFAAPPLKEAVEEVLRATTRAGRELVENGQVSAETMSQIQRDFMDIDTFIEQANRYWAWEIGRNTKKEVLDDL